MWSADGEARPPKITVRVCDSLSCTLAGAEELLRTLQGEKLPGVRVVRAPCIGSCHTAPAAEVGHRHVDHATRRQDHGARRARATCIPRCRPTRTSTPTCKRAATRCCAPASSGARKAEDVIATLSDGGLRGLGGAGFPTGRKWGLVRAEKGPRLMAVNGDEGEPGTFKDRYLSRDASRTSFSRAC